jgi:hypothetical protein
MRWFSPIVSGVALAMALFIVATGTAHIIAQSGEVIADTETYAVYAAALEDRLKVEHKTVERITLLGETRAGDLECPRVELPSEWRPVVENYRQENAHSRIIAPGPDFAVRYAVLTYADLTRLMQQAGYNLSKFSGRQDAGSEVFRSLPGGRLVALSAVGFDGAKTRAMLAIQYNCFPSQQPGFDRNLGLCDEGWQFFVEKRDGQWSPAKLVSCNWIA